MIVIVNDHGHAVGSHSASEMETVICANGIGPVSEKLRSGTCHMDVENLASYGGGEITIDSAEMVTGDQESARGDGKIKVNGGDCEEMGNGGRMESGSEMYVEDLNVVMGQAKRFVVSLL